MTGTVAVPAAQAALYAAATLVATYLLFLLALLAVVMLRAGFLRRRTAAANAIAPALQDRLVDYLAGGDDDSFFQRHLKRHSADIAEAILLFQGTVGGSARDRLCGLALSLGLVQRWCLEARSHDAVRRRAAFTSLAVTCVYEPCRKVAGNLVMEALKDRDEEVRLCACRGVLLAGGDEHIGRLFELAIQPSLLTRIVLTEDLRRHAAELAEGPAREALRSGETQRIRGTLEMLVAWERDLPLEALRDLLEHRDRDIRVLAFRLAAFVSVDFESRLALVRSLRDADAGIRGLAIVAVGRQKMTEAIPELAYCLRREGLEQARHAADALADMPPLGWRALEDLSGNSNPVTALAAREALARARAEA